MADQLVGQEHVERCFQHNQLALEAFGFLCGDYVGQGAFRTVFEYGPDPSKVVKVELGDQSFHNVMEHYVWQRVKDCDHARWFAPVLHISPCGSILLMEKAEDMLSSHLPDRVPAYLTDMAPRNWGRYKGRPVCRDYGSNLLVEVGLTKRMKKARWRYEATPQLP